MTNRWNLPDLGLGVGLRTVHYQHILSNYPRVDWFEIISENFLDTEGRPMYVLDQVAERYPVVMHGVSMSIGSTDPINFEYLRKLKALAKRINAPWVSDHLCWTGVSGKNVHDLLPMPYNEESLKHTVERVKIVSDFLERPLVLENPSSYIEFANSSMTEWDFLAALLEEADCGMLLDINNVYVSSFNHSFDPKRYIDAIPADRVVQYHLAGHTSYGTHIIDTHSDYVIDEVWGLYKYANEVIGSRATLLEWDDDIPDFDTVHNEVLKAQEYKKQGVLVYG
ncbi:MAG: DUF692 domain-containing protein [Acidobacteriota bacterium]|nr:DUF692 domain-containing protein [Blastocatellia bacterium]MDW8412476.1 DUF692 domain-containing protein [Acidobacteriota bacterium]